MYSFSEQIIALSNIDLHGNDQLLTMKRVHLPCVGWRNTMLVSPNVLGIWNKCTKKNMFVRIITIKSTYWYWACGAYFCRIPNVQK